MESRDSAVLKDGEQPVAALGRAGCVAFNAGTEVPAYQLPMFFRGL
jgi:hypothetical protein